jgi:hypothetical protein
MTNGLLTSLIVLVYSSVNLSIPFPPWFSIKHTDRP